MEPAYELAATDSPGCCRSNKVIHPRYFPRSLNDCCGFGKVFPVLFIAVSITMLFLGSVAQAQPPAVQGQAAAQSALLPQTQEETLIVGSEQDYPPFATGMTDAEAGGFTVDLWKAVAVEAGLNYTIRVKPFRETLQDFKEGNTDVLINLARSEERHQFADFTVPHVVVHGAIFVRNGDSNIRTEDDLLGKSIIVLNADLAHDYALAKGWGEQLVPVDTTAKGFRLLASGKHDAILIGKLPGMQTLLALGLTDIKVLKVKVGFSQKFGFAVQKGQSDLLEKINEGLAITKANGTYDLLYEKWFGLYEVKEVGFLDLLKYLIPIFLLFVSIGGYFFYRRQVERKKTEDVFRMLSQAIDQAGESVIITDAEGSIEYVNPSFTRMTGYSAEEVLGKNPRVLKSGNQNKEYYERLWSTITSGKVWHSAVVDRRKDGSAYPALMTISPILNNDGKISHYVGTQQDMTDHEMMEEKFRQAQKMESLGILVGGIAHDFNNMLAGMTGNLYLAKKKTANLPDVVKNLDRVEKLSFRAAEMIQQLLAFARKGSVQMIPFGLTSFIKEIYKLSESSIPENVTFHGEFCQEELVVKGDATQLQQVLMNLINNARDAVAGVQDPMISLKIEGFETDESFANNHPDLYGRLFAHLIVRDNGAGISRADQEHIFEPFFTTKEVGLGTGLGLSMALGAVQSHGGILEVDSSQGEGSSFHIYLPIIKEEKVDIVSEETTEIVSGNGELILMVDDNADVRRTCKEVLENIGYQVLEASSGLEAVEKFTTNQHDISLIIMDVVMPIMGGVQAVERIEKLYPDVKVIFATGYDKDETLKSEMPSGEYTVISKPYSITNLSHVIREKLYS